MATARKYDHEYKVQAVKLAKKIGSGKAAKELRISQNTIYKWISDYRAGRLDIGSRTPENAMTLAKEVKALRKQVEDQAKEIRQQGFYKYLATGTSHENTKSSDRPFLKYGTRT